jgi:hypothetical protein
MALDARCGTKSKHGHACNAPQRRFDRCVEGNWRIVWSRFSGRTARIVVRKKALNQRYSSKLNRKSGNG